MPHRPAVAPELLVLGATASVQVGAALALRLFPRVGAGGAVMLRLVFSAAVLLVALRPRVLGRGRDELRLAAGFGLVLAAMNFSFYSALDRIPIGVAVTLEFLGPLAVAVAGSRRWYDAVWVALAGGGVALLTESGGRIDPAGIALALVAGACWAAYILVNQRVGQVFPGASGLALALGVGGAVLLPWGLVQGGRALANPEVLGLGLGVAMLSSAVPYSLELAALRRMPARVFSVLMSLEPGVAALAGWLIAGQSLSARAIAALFMVSAASLGSALTYRRDTARAAQQEPEPVEAGQAERPTLPG